MLLIYMQHNDVTTVHVRKPEEEKALCGFNHRGYATSLCSPEIDETWLNQPGQEFLCQKCKKSSLKILTNRQNKP